MKFVNWAEVRSSMIMWAVLGAIGGALMVGLMKATAGEEEVYQDLVYFFPQLVAAILGVIGSLAAIFCSWAEPSAQPTVRGQMVENFCSLGAIIVAYEMAVVLLLKLLFG